MKTFLIRYLIKYFDFLQYLSQTRKYDSFRQKYSISESFRFNGNNILFYCDGLIECGSNSYIGENSGIQAYTGCRVEIGRNCMISHNVRIYTQSNISNWDFSNYPIPEKVGNVIVEDYVWIGANVFINP